MGLFDSIIGTSTEEAEPLSEETISDEVDVTGWTGVSTGDDKTSGSGNGGGGSGTGDDSTPTKNKKTKGVVDNETPNIDIGGDLSFSPESEKIEEAAKSSFLDMSEPNNTVVENIVDITTPETAEPISIMSVENTLIPSTENNAESTTEDTKTTETAELINTMPAENTVTEGVTFGEKIAQFLGGLNILRESDEEKIKKIETKIATLKEELKKNQEELKKIQTDEKKIDDTISLLNNVK